MKHADRAKIMRSVQDLLASVTSLIDTLSDAGARARAAAGAQTTKPRKGQRGGARGAWTPARRAKLKKSISGYWAKLTPEQHAERVRKMLAGRGLKPKAVRRKGS